MTGPIPNTPRWGYWELSLALLIALILVAVVLFTSKRKENGRLPIYVSLSLPP